ESNNKTTHHDTVLPNQCLTASPPTGRISSPWVDARNVPAWGKVTSDEESQRRSLSLLVTRYSSPVTALLPGAADDGGQRLEHDLDVQPERPVVDVEQVVAQLHLGVDGVAAVHLGPTGDPRRHLVPLPVVRDLDLEAMDEAGPLRPGADQAHL